MSMENVKRFYELLDADMTLRQEALSLQSRFSDQQKVMDEFIAIAERAGLPFTRSELSGYIFHHGTEVSG